MSKEGMTQHHEIQARIVEGMLVSITTLCVLAGVMGAMEYLQIIDMAKAGDLANIIVGLGIPAVSVGSGMVYGARQ